MSTRPASSWPSSQPSSWPWLDDVLVETGTFDDDPFAVADGTAGVGSGREPSLGPDLGPDLDQWLGSDWFDDTGDAWSGPSASDHDPFHFDPTPDVDPTPDTPGRIGTVADAAPVPDAITSAFLEAIEAVPDVGSEDPLLAPRDGTALRSSDDAITADRSAGPGAGDGLGDLADVLMLPELDPSSPSFGTNEDASSRLDGADVGADDASGDLDDFDGVDGLDDLDGL